MNQSEHSHRQRSTIWPKGDSVQMPAPRCCRTAMLYLSRPASKDAAISDASEVAMAADAGRVGPRLAEEHGSSKQAGRSVCRVHHTATKRPSLPSFRPSVAPAARWSPRSANAGPAGAAPPAACRFPLLAGLLSSLPEGEPAAVRNFRQAGSLLLAPLSFWGLGRPALAIAIEEEVMQWARGWR